MRIVFGRQEEALYTDGASSAEDKSLEYRALKVYSPTGCLPEGHVARIK